MGNQQPVQQQLITQTPGVSVAAGAADSFITADKHTVTYRATVPPNATPEQMDKIMVKLKE